MSEEKDLTQGCTEVDINSCFPCNDFELQSHFSVNSKNIKAMKLFEECIKNNFVCDTNSSTVRDTCEKSYKTGVLSKYEEIKSLKENINSAMKQKELQIAKNTKLKQECTNLTAQLEKLSDEKKIQRSDYKMSLAAFKTAENVYSTNFGLKIKVKNNGDGTCNAVVYFNPKEKKNAVSFHTNQDGQILSFDASSFLHKEQEKLLKERFTETNNIPALICALRKIALKKSVNNVMIFFCN